MLKLSSSVWAGEAQLLETAVPKLDAESLPGLVVIKLPLEVKMMVPTAGVAVGGTTVGRGVFVIVGVGV